MVKRKLLLRLRYVDQGFMILTLMVARADSNRRPQAYESCALTN